MNTIKVILVEENEALRMAMKRYLKIQLNVSIIGEAFCAREFRGMHNRFFADVIIMDVSMQEDEISIMAKYIRDSPRTQVIAVTMHSDKIFTQSLVNAGFNELVPSTELQEGLARVIKNSRQTKYYFTSGKSPDMPQ